MEIEFIVGGIVAVVMIVLFRHEDDIGPIVGSLLVVYLFAAIFVDFAIKFVQTGVL